jgi:hypothetical protein
MGIEVRVAENRVAKDEGRGIGLQRGALFEQALQTDIARVLGDSVVPTGDLVLLRVADPVDLRDPPRRECDGGLQLLFSRHARMVNSSTDRCRTRWLLQIG